METLYALLSPFSRSPIMPVMDMALMRRYSDGSKSAAAIMIWYDSNTSRQSKQPLYWWQYIFEDCIWFEMLGMKWRFWPLVFFFRDVLWNLLERTSTQSPTVAKSNVISIFQTFAERQFGRASLMIPLAVAIASIGSLVGGVLLASR